MPNEPTIAIVGGGAAGLMAAIHAAGPGLRVLVLETTPDGGRKIVASGGGRCNVLPSQADEARFVTDSSPHTLAKMLRSWPLAEQRHFFEEELGVPLALEAETGKLFPASNRARDVRDALVAAARERGAELRFGSAVRTLERGDDGWILRLSSGDRIDAAVVVLATGGLSVPKTGSDGAGLRLAAELGLDVHPTYAALVPLTCEPPRLAALAGVSLDVHLVAPARPRAAATTGGFLFTHRGYSGPAVLDLSHLAVRSLERQEGAAAARQRLLVQWTPLDDEGWQRELAPRRAGVLAALRAHLPARLAATLLDEAGVPAERSLAELRRDERQRLLDALVRFELPWTGHEGFRTAEVTGGGVALSEVDPRTMQARRAPGLFLCGEILDAFGPIGGHNFAWAWATGRAAGLGARAAASGGGCSDAGPSPAPRVASDSRSG